jgi:hypothetical protein
VDRRANGLLADEGSAGDEVPPSAHTADPASANGRPNAADEAVTASQPLVEQPATSDDQRPRTPSGGSATDATSQLIVSIETGTPESTDGPHIPATEPGGSPAVGHPANSPDTPGGSTGATDAAAAAADAAGATGAGATDDALDVVERAAAVGTGGAAGAGDALDAAGTGREVGRADTSDAAGGVGLPGAADAVSAASAVGALGAPGGPGAPGAAGTRREAGAAETADAVGAVGPPEAGSAASAVGAAGATGTGRGFGAADASGAVGGAGLPGAVSAPSAVGAPGTADMDRAVGAAEALDVDGGVGLRGAVTAADTTDVVGAVGLAGAGGSVGVGSAVGVGGAASGPAGDGPGAGGGAISAQDVVADERAGRQSVEYVADGAEQVSGGDVSERPGDRVAGQLGDEVVRQVSGQAGGAGDRSGTADEVSSTPISAASAGGGDGWVEFGERLGELTEVRVRHPERVAEGWLQRRTRALVGDDGRLLIVAADHPARGALGVRGDRMAMGSRADLIARLMIALQRPGVDGVLATPDVLEDLLLLGALEGKVVIGSMNRGGLQGAAFELDDRFTAYRTADEIAARRLDGGKMLTRIDLDDPGTVATLESSAAAVTGLAEHKLMAMVEPFWSTRGEDGRVTNLLDPDSVIKSIQIASALGATSAYTWLKLPVVDELDRVMEATTLPTLLLGGDPTAAPEATYVSWGKALELPSVRGLVVGRALLFPPDGDVAAAVDQAAALVHGNHV